MRTKIQEKAAEKGKILSDSETDAEVVKKIIRNFDAEEMEKIAVVSPKTAGEIETALNKEIEVLTGAEVANEEVKDEQAEQKNKINVGELSFENDEKHFVDNPFDDKGELKPNVRYKTGEFDYDYETDDYGRISRWKTDELHLTIRKKRLKHDSRVKGKLKGDHAGHLAGDRFGGSPKLDNIVSQSAYVNLSKCKRIENKWAYAIMKGKKVTVDVEVIYKGTNERPSGFMVTYYIDGKKVSKYISN